MSLYQTLIMYPMNATSLILGKRLLNEAHSVSLYCPTEVTKRLAHTVAADLEVEALGLSSKVEEVATLENLKIYNYVIFPTMDLDPHEPRSNFALMCADLFRYNSQFSISYFTMLKNSYWFRNKLGLSWDKLSLN